MPWISDDEAEQYDEAQGLTDQMVEEWLLKNGWCLSATNRMYFKEVDGAIIAATRRDKGGSLWWIAEQEKITLQQLLRVMNPRMRPGWPSDSALSAHKTWIMTITDSSKNILSYWGSYARVRTKAMCDDREGTVSCWPCDSHGNKVRWPTDDKGNML